MPQATYHDRVKETTATTGTGNITLLGAVAQFQAFSPRFAIGERFTYAIAGQTGTEWEVGIGEMLTATTFQRVEVTESSNADALVSFSAGTKDVWNDITARDMSDEYSGGMSLALTYGMGLQ